MKLDLSRDQNIPEAIADNRPNDFIGVYVEDSTIKLPEEWFQAEDNATLAIKAKKLLVGTGGISGKVSLEAVGENPGSELIYTLGKKPSGGSGKGFKIGLQVFSLEFLQGSFSEAELKGSLYFPSRLAPDGDNKISVDMFLDHDGNFDITATFNGTWNASNVTDLSGGIFGTKNIFLFKMDYVSVGKDETAAYLETAGTLRFTHPAIRKIIKEDIVLKKLRINTDGGFEIEGGSIALPKNAELKIGPAKISITGIHCGTMERGGHSYKYWGFDGGLSVNPGGVDARGDGIKFCYRKDDQGTIDWFIHIEGIGIDLVIPSSSSKEQAALLMQGYLSLKDPIYYGSISFQMPKAKLAGGASMAYDTRAPAWIVDAFLDLPVALPLASTGLGIYGFRGLFGFRYVASKSEDESWFDYYKKTPEGINIQKMYSPSQLEEMTDHPPIGMKNPFSVGAGATLATMPDDGYTFSMKLMLLVSIPTLIMLDGRANILSKRVGLTDEDPPFWAFVSFSPQDKSLEMGIGADYKIPRKTGDILDLQAAMEAGYFFNNSSAWYVNFGTKSKPIQAKIFRMFDAYSYLMLSAQGISAGAGLHFEFNKSYPPVSIAANAYFDVWGYLSFERPQIGGGIAIGGSIDVRVCGLSLYISLQTLLTAEASKPFRIAGSAELCVKINLLFFKLEKCFTIQFVWERSKLVDLSPVFALPEDGKPATGRHMQSGNTYDVAYKSGGNITKQQIDDAGHVALPLDTFIDLQFAKPVKPISASFAGLAEKIGGVTTAPRGDVEILPPRNSSRKVRHSYDITNLQLQVYDADEPSPEKWKDYDPYIALDARLALIASGQPMPQGLKMGFWQKKGLEYNGISFLAQSPFEYMNPIGGYQPEEMGLDSETILCENPALERYCVDWLNRRGSSAGQTHFKDGVYYRLLDEDGKILTIPNPFNFQRSLALHPDSDMQIYFPEAAGDVTLKLSSFAKSVTIHYQRLVLNIESVPGTPAPFETQVTQTDDYEDIIPPITVPTANLSSPQFYIDAENPVKRILIKPARPEPSAVQSLQGQIDRLSESLIRAKINKDEARIDQLQKSLQTAMTRLDRLLNSFCAKRGNNGVDAFVLRLKELSALLEDNQTALENAKEDYDKSCPVDDVIEKKIAKDMQRRFQEPLIINHQGKDMVARLPGKQQAKQINRIDAARNKLNRQSNQIATDIQVTLRSRLAECEAKARHIAELERTIASLREEITVISEQFAIHDPAQEPLPEPWCCATFIHEICWLSQSATMTNANIPAQASINQDITDMTNGVNMVIRPIWRPHEYFRILIETEDRVSLQNKTPTPHRRRFSVGFKTGGPIGFYKPIQTIDAPSDPEKPAFEASPITPESKLAFYIDNRKSFPDPSGNIGYAKPLYCHNATIELAFTKHYVAHFFAHWDSYQGRPEREFALDISIIDPALPTNPLPSPAPDHEAPVLTSSELPEALVTPVPDKVFTPGPDLAVLQNFLDVPDPCRPSIPEPPLSPSGVKYVAETLNLKARKTYTAVIRNHDKSQTADPAFAEVHRFPFVTSRYNSFADHIGSYKTQYPDAPRIATEFGQNVFELNLDFGTLTSIIVGRIEAAAELMINPLQGDTNTYPDLFDRLIYGHLGLQAIAPPSGTEFNFLRALDNFGEPGAYFALLVRSDEPFNDPRLTDGELQKSIRLKTDGQAITDMQVLFSRDRTQAILMKPKGLSVNFPQTDITAVFLQKGWQEDVLTEIGSRIETEILQA